MNALELRASRWATSSHTTHVEGGSCTTGVKGSWNTDAYNIRSMGDCVARCRGCSRCRYVSLSLAAAHQDCSWYAACDLRRLIAAPRTGPDYASVAVRKP